MEHMREKDFPSRKGGKIGLLCVSRKIVTVSPESFFFAITHRSTVPYGNSGKTLRIFPDFF